MPYPPRPTYPTKANTIIRAGQIPKRHQTVQQLPEHFTIRSLDLGYGPERPRPPEHLTIRHDGDVFLAPRRVRLAAAYSGSGTGPWDGGGEGLEKHTNDPCFRSRP